MKEENALAYARSQGFDSLLAYANSLSDFQRHNGMLITEIGDGSCTVEVTLTENSNNFQQIAHGGLIYSLCDTAGGMAADCLYPPFGVTISGSLNYLRPGIGKKLFAKGTLVKAGRTVQVADTDVYNEEGMHVAHGTFTYYLQRSDS